MAQRRLEGVFNLGNLTTVGVHTYVRDTCFSPMHTDSCFVEVNTRET